MVALIRHVETGIVLDLRHDDLGHPDGVAIFNEWRGRLGGKDRGRFLCEVADCDARDAPVYLQLRPGGVRVACHYDSGIVHRAVQPETDEHKWKKDYTWRAADDVGWPSVLERRIRTRQPDVTISGVVTIGAEVQRSTISRETVMARTRDHAKANVQSLWLYEAQKDPGWAAFAPSSGTNLLPWNQLPEPGSWQVTRGVGRIRLYRCEIANTWRFPGGRCPDGHRRPCRKEHPAYSAEPIFADRYPFGRQARAVVGKSDIGGGWKEVAFGLSVDQMIAMAPAGELVAVRLKKGWAWVPADDAAVFKQAGGTPAASWTPTGPGRAGAEIADCSRPHAEPGRLRPVAASTAAAPPGRQPRARLCVSCGDAGRLYPTGVFCEKHRPAPAIRPVGRGRGNGDAG